MPGNSAKGAKRKTIIELEVTPTGADVTPGRNVSACKLNHETPSVHWQTAFLFLNFFNKMRSPSSAVSGRCL